MTSNQAVSLREQFKALLLYPKFARELELDLDAAERTLRSLCKSLSQDDSPIDDDIAEMIARFVPGALWPGCTHADAIKVFAPKIDMWVAVCARMIEGK